MNVEIDKKLIVTALVVMLGGNVTGFMNMTSSEFRKDGVTLTYVNKEFARIDRKFENFITSCELRHAALVGEHQAEIHDLENDFDDYNDAELRRHTDNEINIKNLQWRMANCEKRYK